MVLSLWLTKTTTHSNEFLWKAHMLVNIFPNLPEYMRMGPFIEFRNLQSNMSYDVSVHGDAGGSERNK